MAPEIEPDEIDDNDPKAPAQLRAAYERATARAAKVEALERENAMLKAGVDVSTRKGQAFMKTFDGDLGDIAGIVADAKEFDPEILKASAPAEASTEGTGNEGQQQQGTQGGDTAGSGSAQRGALADGALPSGAATQNVREAALEASQKALKSGADLEIAGGGLVNALVKGVREGTVQPLQANGRRSPQP
jgi:hypothetical protein